MKTWNRPTSPWSLECEEAGKTREDAIEKTKIQLSLSDGEEQVANIGYAITIIYPFLCCCGACCTVFAGGKE